MAALLPHVQRRSPAYNVDTIRREIPYPDIVAIRWAEREQGLLVAPNNPLGINSLEDLFTKKPRIIVRPEGAGSRVLFDSLIQELGRDEAQLDVLASEAQTEGDLAAMIAEGEADAVLALPP
jgi:molybdate-binding protein